jgi:hypothetical protein
MKTDATPKTAEPPSSESPSTPCSQLFRVKVTYDTVIRAESEEEARREVQYGMGDIDDAPTEIEIKLIKTLKDLPPVWGEKCLPWGERDPYDRNIGQILSANS